MIVDASARAVAIATQELINRDIDRNEIRCRALARMKRFRETLLEVIHDILNTEGASESAEELFSPFPNRLVSWQSLPLSEGAK
jgi:hypothetical protein